MSFTLDAPNTTQTPNKFFDVLLPTLSDAEVRVMLHLIRQTYGWRREWTTNGYGRVRAVAKGCGLSVHGAMNALTSLRERGLIESRKAGLALEYRILVSPAETDLVQPSETSLCNDVEQPPCNDVVRIKRQTSKPNHKTVASTCVDTAASEDRHARWQPVYAAAAAALIGDTDGWHKANGSTPLAVYGRLAGRLGAACGDDPLAAAAKWRQFVGAMKATIMRDGRPVWSIIGTRNVGEQLGKWLADGAGSGADPYRGIDPVTGRKWVDFRAGPEPTPAPDAGRGVDPVTGRRFVNVWKAAPVR